MANMNVGGGLSRSTPAPKPAVKKDFEVLASKKALPMTGVQKAPAPVYRAPVAAPKPTPVFTNPGAPVAGSASSYSPATNSLVQAASVTEQPAVPSFADLTKQYLDETRGNVNTLYDEQKNSRLAQLKAQRDAAMGQINQQKLGTKQDYYNQRNQADVVNVQNVARLREIMAANGINASGENLTTQAAANSDRMNSLNALNQQEQFQMNEYENQISALNNPAEEQSIISQIEAERAKALLDADNTATERAWRSHTFNNMSATEKAQLEWAKSQYGEDAAWRMFELNYNGEMQKSVNQAQISALGFNQTQGGGDYSQYKISSGYGMRADPMTGKQTLHKGIDIAMPKGSPVGTTVGGTVIYAGFGQPGSGYGGYGNVVVVRDANGNVHQYSHLDSIGVKVGQQVGSGGLVGKAGSTGKSTGPHLDYMVKNSKGSTVNPTSYIGR